jgi:hypothetical protein
MTQKWQIIEHISLVSIHIAGIDLGPGLVHFHHLVTLLPLLVLPLLVLPVAALDEAVYGLQLVVRDVSRGDEQRVDDVRQFVRGLVLIHCKFTKVFLIIYILNLFSMPFLHAFRIFL